MHIKLPKQSKVLDCIDVFGEASKLAVQLKESLGITSTKALFLRFSLSVDYRSIPICTIFIWAV